MRWGHREISVHCISYTAVTQLGSGLQIPEKVSCLSKENSSRVCEPLLLC